MSDAAASALASGGVCPSRLSPVHVKLSHVARGQHPSSTPQRSSAQGSSSTPKLMAPLELHSRRIPTSLQLPDGDADPSHMRPLPPIALNADMQKGSAANRWMIFWSSVSLVIAVASMSAVGPLFLFLQQRGISAMLACSWRNQTMCLFLALPALAEWMRLPVSQRSWEALRVQTAEEEENRGKQSPFVMTPHSGSIESARHNKAQLYRDQTHSEETQPLFHFPNTPQARGTPRQSPRLMQQQQQQQQRQQPPPSATKGWHVSWYLLAVCITWAGSLVLWVVALPYTSTPRASLFCSTYPLLLVPYMKYVQGIQVSRGEVVGVAISFAGILTSEMTSLMADHTADTAAATTTGSVDGSVGADWTPSQRQMYGDLLCVGSSLLIGVNILFAERTRKVLPLFSYSFSSAVIVLVMLTLGAMTGEGASFDTHPTRGVFGWVHGDMLWLNLLFGFVVGMIGVLGFNFAVKYVNPLIFASTQLLDPGLTGILSWLAGLEGWPSTETLLSIGVVTIGIAFITFGQQQREAAEQAQKSKGMQGKRVPAADKSGMRSPQFAHVAGVHTPAGNV